MKNYFLHIDSFGVPIRIHLNQVLIYSLDNKTGMKTKIAVNEWIQAGENILSVQKQSGEILEHAEMKIEILSGEGTPKEDEDYDVLASIENYSLPINLSPFVVGPLWYGSKLENAQVIDITDENILKKIKALTIEVHSAFFNQDMEKIISLFKTRLIQYDKAYGLEMGDREAEFRKVIGSYFSSAKMIIMNENGIMPRLHFFGKVVDMYYPKYNFNTVVFYDEANGLDHIIDYYFILNSEGKLEIVR